MTTIFTVSELTRSVKNLLEAEFPFVWVRGQVSNLSRPASGHIYFTLTDGDTTLSVVWFKSSQTNNKSIEQDGERINPLTGEIEEISSPTELDRTRIKENLEVLCAGRLNVYEPRGQYQLVAELVQSQGTGNLALAFEALKKKLAEKGYFDSDRKLTIPQNIHRVAVITSASGAAIHDFLRIAGSRGINAEIRIYPTLVQGEEAPAQIVQALDQADDDNWADVAVLIRGGGSLEDLWAFNTELVADAIYRARIPIITGIGHEPDTSIADYVADKRVATPSHAAQELWPRRETLAQMVDDLDLALNQACHNWLKQKNTDFENLQKALVWLSPTQKVKRMEDQLKMLLKRLYDGGNTLFARKKSLHINTLKQLQRAHGPQQIESMITKITTAVSRLDLATTHLFDTKKRDLGITDALLQGLDPEAPLNRGYSLIQIERTGKFLRAPKDVTQGDTLDIRIKDGRVRAIVADAKNTSQEIE